jgi:hypothetical protein
MRSSPAFTSRIVSGFAFLEEELDRSQAVLTPVQVRPDNRLVNPPHHGTNHCLHSHIQCSVNTKLDAQRVGEPVSQRHIELGLCKRTCL